MSRYRPPAIAEQGSRVTRFAVILAGLTLSLLAASPAEAARTEFFGIAHARIDDQDLQRIADSRVRTEPLPAPVEEGESEPGNL